MKRSSIDNQTSSFYIYSFPIAGINTLTMTRTIKNLSQLKEKKVEINRLVHMNVQVLLGEYHTYNLLGGLPLNDMSIYINTQNKNNEHLTKNVENNKLQETGFYESTNVASIFSDHTYDPLESADYFNMTNVSVPSAK